MTPNNLDYLHEKNKATLMVDAPRFIKSLEYSNVSSLHYSPFYLSDIVAERYLGSSGRKQPDDKKITFRLFSRDELTVPIVEFHNNENSLDIEKEKMVFGLGKKV